MRSARNCLILFIIVFVMLLAILTTAVFLEMHHFES